jgi:hypothetical protein
MSKSVWGPATWQLLHCMVLKINDNINKSQLSELKGMIINIATNLPCPYCTQHALSYLKTNKFNLIDNIYSLRIFMHTFHNKVNERLKKTTMSYEDHIVLYSRMNFKIVIQNMIHIYKNMNTSVTMMLYSYYRGRLVQDLNEYFYNNQQIFSI